MTKTIKRVEFIGNPFHDEKGSLCVEININNERYLAWRKPETDKFSGVWTQVFQRHDVEWLSAQLSERTAEWLASFKGRTP